MSNIILIALSFIALATCTLYKKTPEDEEGYIIAANKPKRSIYVPKPRIGKRP